MLSKDTTTLVRALVLGAGVGVSLYIAWVYTTRRPRAAAAAATAAAAAAAATATPKDDSTIIRPLRDTRGYRQFVLGNGLRCLVISDPATAGDGESESDGEGPVASGPETNDSESESEGDLTDDGADSQGEDSSDEVSAVGASDDDANRSGARDHAAAALTVGVGSFWDTDDLQGMAHFVEHMVFMGSVKYPDENAFDNFLTKHGGGCNAYTDMERTTYMFDVQRKYLKEGLDIFAQFFICPLMLEGAMDRELEAIDSEFSMSQQSDGSRKFQVLSGLANKQHPVSRFTWGNVKSLKSLPEQAGVPVRATLQQFWKTHYSASRMALVVLGEEGLDELEAMVRETFSTVASDGEPARKVEPGLEPWSPDVFHLQTLFITPVKEVHDMEFLWLLPPVDPVDDYKSSPHSYVADLIGHEGSGSILAALKRQGWATSLVAGTSDAGDDCNSSYIFFTVGVSLTEEGMQHQSEVGRTVLQYIEMLRRVGPQKRFWDEERAVAECRFMFKEQYDPSEYCETLAPQLLTGFPEEHLLTAYALRYEWVPEKISAVLDLLQLDKMLVSIMSKSVQDRCDSVEPWFGDTQWGMAPVPSEWVALWKEGVRGELPDELHLPPPNDFIPSDFSLLEVEPEAEDGLPCSTVVTDGAALWHVPDGRFRVPRSTINLQIVTPGLYCTARAAALSELFIHVLDFNLKPISYAADMASQHFQISLEKTGMVVRVWGFSHKQMALVTAILEHMRDFQCDSQPFAMVKETLIRQHRNSLKKRERYARSLRLQMLMGYEWPASDLIAELESVTVADLLGHVASVLSQGFLKALTHGNQPAEFCREVVDTTTRVLGIKSLPREAFPDVPVHEVPAGEHWLVVPTVNEADDTSMVECYYQIGGADDRHYVLTDLLVDLMSEPIFNELRTNQQLGYSVGCALRLSNGHLGFMIQVQPKSSKFSVVEVNRRIEEFLAWFRTHLQAMPDDDFQAFLAAGIEDKLRPDSNLGERTNRLWGQVIDNAYKFREMEEHASILTQITKDDVLGWFDLHLHPETATRRKLVVMVAGSGDASVLEGTRATVYSTVAEFVQSTKPLPSFYDVHAHEKMRA